MMDPGMRDSESIKTEKFNYRRRLMRRMMKKRKEIQKIHQ